MNCPKCKAVNREGTTRCVICNARLPKHEPALTPQNAIGEPKTEDALLETPNEIAAISGRPGEAVNSYLIPAILTTLFCCLPFGVVGIIYASQVSGKVAAGDLKGAKAAANSAKTWSIVSLLMGLGIVMLNVLGMILGALAASRRTRHQKE